MKARTGEGVLAVVYGRTPSTKGGSTCGSRATRTTASAWRPRRPRGASRHALRTPRRVPGAKAGLSLLLCTLVTGRTHQIRVHLKAMRLPSSATRCTARRAGRALKDEELSGRCKTFPGRPSTRGGLGIPHPVSGLPITFAAPVPADIAGLFSWRPASLEPARFVKCDAHEHDTNGGARLRTRPRDAPPPIRKLMLLVNDARSRGGATVPHLNIGRAGSRDARADASGVLSKPKRTGSTLGRRSNGTPQYLDTLKTYYARMGVPLETSEILATTVWPEALGFAFMACSESPEARS